MTRAVKPVRGCAENGSQREGDYCRREDGTGAKAVGQPTADRDEHGEGEHVSRHADVKIYGTNIEAARHLGKRGRDDGAV